MDFLADNNVCGQTLLRLIARGNSIIAELKRLSSVIPTIFRLETKQEQQKYSEILLDFAYFQSPEVYIRRIENSESLLKCDNEIRDHYLSVVSRIYAVFESVHRYAAHLNAFLKDLNDGTFIHMTMDAVFADYDGKQLMCEGLYLSGSMLLLVDRLFPAALRERLIVSHHRHAGLSTRSPGDTHVDDVCRLLRATGLKPAAKRPAGYPEDYFNRLEMPSDYTEQVVGHLRTDDIYNQVSVYPSPAHRPTAFSGQAAMLYVCLYFTPTALHNNTHRMREVVDRFFPDNWVLSYYMGTTTNLIEAWEPYKAARQALTNTLESSNVKQTAASFGSKLTDLTNEARQLESEGALTEEKVLGSSGPLFRLVRECNVTLRWMVLHCATLEMAGGAGHKKCRAIREVVLAESQYSPQSLFKLLLHTAGLELKITQIYKRLLSEKVTRWEQHLQTASDRLLELAEAFSAEAIARPLTRVRPNKRLNQWFTDTAHQVTGLEVEGDPQPTARRIIQIVHALNQVKEYHDLCSSGGAVQAVGEATTALEAVARLAAAEDADTAVLATVADLSYAWTLVDQYTPIMQASIKKEPSSVCRLRSVFLKLSSGLELPLLRITQARSQDALSVSAFYSGRLVQYVRRVLQIIPETMFSLLGSIVELQTHHLTELPSRLEKEKMRDLAQLDHRHRVSALCHSVGQLAEGVRQMGLTLVGVVEVQPRQLLEDGVRGELVRRVAGILNTKFSFTVKKVGSDLMDRLAEVARLLKGFRSSFEYIQDYINLYALKIWHEELTRIISVNVEQECSQLVLRSASASDEGGHMTPVPLLVPGGPHRSFVGSLVAEVLAITDPKLSTYCWATGAWYDHTRARNQLVDGGQVMSAIEEAITTAGLAGVDRVLGCSAQAAVEEWVQGVATACGGAGRDLLGPLMTHTTPHTAIIDDRQYSAWVARYSRLTTPALVVGLQRLGQLQLLRLHASHRLAAACSLEANHLQQALQALNVSMLDDMRRHEGCPPSGPHPDPAPHNPLTTQLTSMLEWAGLTNPLHRIYTLPPESVSTVLPHTLLLLLLSVLHKLQPAPKLGGVVSARSADGVDGAALCVGAATVLRQLHPRETDAFMALMAQYISARTLYASDCLPVEVLTAVVLLRQLAQLMSVPQQQLAALLPGDLLFNSA